MNYDDYLLINYTLPFLGVLITAIAQIFINISYSKYRTVPIESLCRTLFTHIKSWCSSNSVSNFKYTYVFDNEHNSDDRLFYKRLCDNERADHLLEQFNKENNERNGD